MKAIEEKIKSDPMPPSKEKKPKDLSKIVLEMLIENKSEEEIIESLEEVGVDKEEAKEIYKKVSKEYHDYMKERLGAKVEEIFKEQTDEMVKRFEEKMKDTFEETQLKVNLNFSEIKEKIDSKIGEPKEKAQENKERIKQLRAETERGYSQLRKNMERMEEIGPIGALVPIITIIIGLISVLYSLKLIPDHPEFLQEPLLLPPASLGIILIGVIAGVILTGFGIMTILRRRKIKKNIFQG